MRVTMVITSYHPIVGGAERQLAQVARLMQADGHQLTVVTRHHAGLPERELVDGVDVLRIRTSGPKPLRALRFIVGAARAVRGSRPDVIHCHSLFTPVLAGIVGGLGTGVPVLAKPMCGGEALGIAAKPFGRLRMAFCRSRLAAVIAISGEIRDELVGLGFDPARIADIPNGVDLQRFSPVSDATAKAEARRRLGLPSDGYIFGFAGRLAAQKMVPLLLQAFRRLAAERPDLHLAIASANRVAGGGASVDDQDTSGIEPALLSQPRVHLLGQVDDMPGFLTAVDAFVLPSSREGLSNALLEACAAGLPTVSARIGGNAEIVQDGSTGLLFSAGSEDDLVATMARLADDPALGQRLGKAARARMEETFALTATVRRLLDLYTKLQRARA
ncbi:glycosyltransferase family 4 protein [Tabrizicola sp.]|uniref:glycosyltransferase family 4 protein n=1 Tax=Tabrizicola sp. TaxID=2005166 RepID=UPI003F3B0E3E